MTDEREPAATRGLNPAAVGDRIRTRRRELGLTLTDVAQRTQLSKSFLSQVEIGKSWPSVNALAQISAVLDLPTRDLVGELGDHAAGPARRVRIVEDDEPDRTVRVVRKGQRKRLSYPGGRNPLDLLTPDLQRRFEVTLTDDAPGMWYEVERPRPDAEEFALVLDGTYEIHVGDDTHTVHAGDSIYFSPGRRFRLRAVGQTSGRAIWIAIPPAF